MNYTIPISKIDFILLEKKDFIIDINEQQWEVLQDISDFYGDIPKICIIKPDKKTELIVRYINGGIIADNKGNIIPKLNKKT